MLWIDAHHHGVSFGIDANPRIPSLKPGEVLLTVMDDVLQRDTLNSNRRPLVAASDVIDHDKALGCTTRAHWCLPLNLLRASIRGSGLCMIRSCVDDTNRGIKLRIHTIAELLRINGHWNVRLNTYSLKARTARRMPAEHR